MQKVIGIDAGGTLTKLAFINEQNELQYKVFPSNNFSLVKDWIESN
ncbi:type II pantothenate kinase, partial [Butyricicoccus sp. 1XD8-22]